MAWVAEPGHALPKVPETSMRAACYQRPDRVAHGLCGQEIVARGAVAGRVGSSG